MFVVWYLIFYTETFLSFFYFCPIFLWSMLIQVTSVKPQLHRVNWKWAEIFYMIQTCFIAKICVKVHVSNHKILIDDHCKENNICMSFWQLCLHFYRRLLAPTPGTTSWKVPRGTLELLWYPVQWAVHHYQHANQKICWLSIQEVQCFKTPKNMPKILKCKDYKPFVIEVVS